MIQEMIRAVTNKYDRHARLYPALFAVLPLSLLLGLALAPALPGASAAGSILVASGLPLLAMGVARSKGKQLEPKLYMRWGCKPTTTLLRFNSASNDTQVQRWHDKLQKLVGSDLTIPSREYELNAPTKADDIYDTALAALREATRDTKKYYLAFNELCDYGLKRNLLGLKPIGLFLVGLSIVILLIAYTLAPGQISPQTFLMLAFADGLLGSFWLFSVNERWVKTAAFTYAGTLLAALERS